MECPRCDRSLTTYELEDHEAIVCEACGYVGVDIDHSADPVVVESWNEALRRFRDE